MKKYLVFNINNNNACNKQLVIEGYSEALKMARRWCNGIDSKYVKVVDLATGKLREKMVGIYN